MKVEKGDKRECKTGGISEESRLDFFFFKQKTAYEIRNCDWSSDVCSSDLELLVCYNGIAESWYC